METTINTVTTAAASGIPKLYEWGGMVTLLVLMVALLCAALGAMAWIIWQMYKGNQDMFRQTIDAANRSTNAIEKLTEYVKGGNK